MNYSLDYSRFDNIYESDEDMEPSEAQGKKKAEKKFEEMKSPRPPSYKIVRPTDHDPQQWEGVEEITQAQHIEFNMINRCKGDRERKCASCSVPFTISKELFERYNGFPNRLPPDWNKENDTHQHELDQFNGVCEDCVKITEARFPGTIDYYVC